jgi:subtilisin family serine protease
MKFKRGLSISLWWVIPALVLIAYIHAGSGEENRVKNGSSDKEFSSLRGHANEPENVDPIAMGILGENEKTSAQCESGRPMTAIAETKTPADIPESPEASHSFVDEGDHYLVRGKKVLIRRDMRRMVVKFKEAAFSDFEHYAGQPQEQSRALRSALNITDSEMTLSVERQFDKRRIAIIRVNGKPEDISLRSQIQDFNSSPAVEYVYPLFVGKTGTDELVVTDEILARFFPEYAEPEVRAFCAENDLSLKGKTRGRLNVYVLRLNDPKSHSCLEVANSLNGMGGIVWAEPNFLFPIKRNTVDPLYGDQWHLNNRGQGGGRSDADVDAPEAWALQMGDPNIVIAITDDGVDLDHEDLEVWYNPGESGDGKENNGVDDDGNGYVDDYRGWDFFDNDNDPNPIDPEDNHGTACTGVAAARGDNGLGVAGMAYGCPALSIKICRGDNFIDTRTIGEAIEYSADLADVISCSWGGDYDISYVMDGIDYAVTSGRGGLGCAVFCATGNGADMGEGILFPARYINTIAVGACNNMGTWSSYSQYGNEIDFVTPSDGGTLAITTTDRTGSAGYNSGSYFQNFGGTSSATPLAAGIAALILSMEPMTSASDIRDIMRNTCDKIGGTPYDDSGWNKYYGHGRVNAYKALTCRGILRFSSSEYTVGEDGVSAVLKVQRTFRSSGNITVNVATSDGTATAGADYAATSQNLFFGNGETEKTFSIQILDELEIEEDETVIVTLSNPGGGAVLGSPNTAELTILDNEYPTLPYSQDFSDGMPGNGWEFYSSNNYGRIQVTDGRLGMDVSSNNHYALNEATLTLDMSCFEGVQLCFFQAELGDEPESLPLNFTGHYDGDGVVISHDGNTWYTIKNASDLDVGSSGQTFTVDMDACVADIQSNYDPSFVYSPSFKIKFQQFDDCSYNTDGRVWDDVSVTGNIDKTPPTVEISYSEPGPFTYTDTITVTATLTDVNKIAGIPQIAIDYAGTGSDISATDMASTENNHVWVYGIDIPNGNDGPATITVTGADVAGNPVGVHSGNTFVVDNTAPYIQQYPMIDYANNAIEVSYSETGVRNVTNEDNYSFIPSLDFATVGNDISHPTGNTYRLAMASIPKYTIFTLTISNILDAAGNPMNPSTIAINDNDDDSMADDWESYYRVDSPNDDPDNDGLTNIQEFNAALSTDPNDPDTDHDEMPDGWEVTHGLDALADDAHTDVDGDLFSNLQEYLRGSDPNDPNSVPANNAPAAPSGNYPSDSAETTFREPFLSVSNSEDPDDHALTYTFEVYADAALTSLVTSVSGIQEGENTTKWQVDVILNDDSFYYWRARAFDAIEYSEWMDAAKFFVNTVNDAPSIPNLSMPPDHTEVTSLYPTLEVTNVYDIDLDPLTYEFEVYLDENGHSLKISATDVPEGNMGVTFWKVDIPLQENTSFWWRTQSRDNENEPSGWSPLFTFFVNTENDSPSAPMINSPKNGEEIGVLDPALVIDNSTDADLDTLTYFFEIDTVNTFDSSSLQKSVEVFEGTGNITSWKPIDITDHTTYYWRARANDGATYSDWILGSFFVNLSNDPPTTPTINKPEDNSYVTTLFPTLIINPSTDADFDEISYDFEVSLDSGFSELEASTNGTGTSWQVNVSLVNSDRYYWRARAVDEHGDTSEWSSASFLVNFTNHRPTIPTLNNPVSGGIAGSLTPTVSIDNSSDMDNDTLTYDFELYSDNDLTNKVDFGTVPQGKLITSWTVSSLLINKAAYYWRARANDGLLTSSWTPTAVFVVDTDSLSTTVEVEVLQNVSSLAQSVQRIEVMDDNSPINGVCVEVPPGTLPNDCTITIGLVINPPALPDNTKAIGRVIEFGPASIIFTKPVSIMIPYSEGDLDNAGIKDPNELDVFTYNSSALSWEQIPVDGIDYINKLLIGKADHFSMYTTGKSFPAPPPGSGGGGCFVETVVFNLAIKGYSGPKEH